MSKTNRTTDASKVELTDEELDGAEGGAGFLKLGDIEGESVIQPKTVSSTSWKMNASPTDANVRLDKSSTKIKY
ncbi:MAG: hypothetical protein AB8B85_01060 [Paracoccaceae bacterium]